MRCVCRSCGETHDGVPGLSAAAPLYYYSVPEPERAGRCALGSETCVVDERFFFVRGCLEVPIHGESEPFVWGLWVSVSRRSFETIVAAESAENRSHRGPFFGWLSARLEGYPDTENLKTRIHLRDRGIRPFIELEPTGHPLAVEQRVGISVERAGEILASYLHGEAVD